MRQHDRQSGKRNRRFSFWPIAAFCCLLPLLLSLGVWQLQRGADKQADFAAFENAVNSAPLDVRDLSISEFNALPRYRQVRLTGHYLDGRQFLLDNLSHAGWPGHHVLTPFVPTGADYAVIVDRGWRAGRAAKAPEGIAVDGKVREIRGMLAPFPRPGLDLGSGEIAPGWPKQVQFPDANELARLLARDVTAPRLLLDADAADGFLRDWQPPGIPPARHYAYAFQWFALAATLATIFVYMLWRGRRGHNSEVQ